MSSLVEDVMTTDVIWVNPNDNLFDAFQIMQKFNVRHLPVVELGSSKVVGMLSEGDILLYCTKKGKRMEIDKTIKVEKAMTKEIVFCYPSSLSANVAATMISAKIDSLPVLKSSSHELVGIITSTDLLNELCLAEELKGQYVKPLKFSNSGSRKDWHVEKSG